MASRGSKREIRLLEDQVSKWQVLVDTVTGISPPEFDNQTLAVLRGRLVRFVQPSAFVVSDYLKECRVTRPLGGEGGAILKQNSRWGSMRFVGSKEVVQ